MEVLLVSHGRYFPPYVVCEWKRAYCTFRSALNLLANLSLQKKLCRYHMRPKAHFLGHVTWHYLPKNPRYFMCYLDEDYIARTKRLAEKAHPLHMSKITLFRYVINTSLRFAGLTA